MTTTITVPVAIRDRVRAHAHARGQTPAAVLEHALDLLEREAFFDQLRADIDRRPELPAEGQERDEWLAGPVALDG